MDGSLERRELSMEEEKAELRRELRRRMEAKARREALRAEGERVSRDKVQNPDAAAALEAVRRIAEARAAREIERSGEEARLEDGGFVPVCPVCGEPKRALIDWLPDADGNPRRMWVPVTCRCDDKRRELETREQRKQQFRFHLKEMLERFEIETDRTRRFLEQARFDADDSPEGGISRTCRKYVSAWKEMRRENLGILFFGSVGTGKSFYAGCVVNALREMLVPAAFLTAPELLGILQGQWDRGKVLANLQEFRLLVIDDLGAERDSAYGAELLHSVIDARYRARLPLVVTTNLSMEDMRGERDLRVRRIYDRVIEACPITLAMQGESRRTGSADRRKDRAREILKAMRTDEAERRND